MTATEPLTTPSVSSANPVPLAAEWYTAPFWDAAASGRLVCARCADCGLFRMPPSPRCGTCQSAAIDWVEQGQLAELYTYTVVRRTLPDSGRAAPFVIAVVRLPDAGAVKMVTSIVDTPPELLRIGASVKLGWQSVDGVTVPVYTLRD